MVRITAKSIFKWSSLVFIWLAGTGISAAAEYYVSTTGNDTTGNGTMANPYQTIQYVLNNVAASGDIITLRGGTYAENVRGGQVRLLGHLVISSPAQASTWNAGSVMPIRWDTSGITGNVKVSISSQGGKDGTFQTIIDGTPNNGSYDWTVNAGVSVNCVLKVEHL